MQVWSLDQEDPLEEEMTTHSSIFTRKALDRGACGLLSHGFAKSWTQLSDWACTSVRIGQISVAPNNKHLFLFCCIGNVGILFPLRDVDFCHLKNYWIHSEMERGSTGFALGIKWFCPKAICVTCSILLVKASHVAMFNFMIVGKHNSTISGREQDWNI